MSFLRDVAARTERVVASTVVDLVDDPRVADVILELGKWGATAVRGIEDVRSTAVHMLSLPSHRDVRLLAARVALLHTALTELQAQVNERQQVDDPEVDRVG